MGELALARSDGISDIRIRLLPEFFNSREMHSRFRAVSKMRIASSELVFGNRMNGGIQPERVYRARMRVIF